MFVSPKGFPQIKSVTDLKQWLYEHLTVEQRRCDCGNMIINQYKYKKTIFAHVSSGFIICVKCHKDYRIKELLALTKETLSGRTETIL